VTRIVNIQTVEERKAYEELVHSKGGKTLKDLLKEQGDI
tara:strand:+ start:343 stop:459 length:117 start_codon:yes stop_codon:yes gene_type:complete